MLAAVRRFLSHSLGKVAAVASGTRHAKPDAQLNVHNVKLMLGQAPRAFEFLRFDPNNDCNVHCVYCHNHRSKDLVATEELESFLQRNVITVENFQVGCIMEPTLDPRMCDLMLLVASSRARPRKLFLLQTNGILLHKHDQSKMRDAGLTDVFISIDAADPATHKALRGGTSMAKVGANIEALRRHSPGIRLVFVTTVTRLNVHAMEELVDFGLGLGVDRFVMREVFYLPHNDVVDHSRMPELLLAAGEFSRLKQHLMATFGARVRFEFADAPGLGRSAERMRVESFR